MSNLGEKMKDSEIGCVVTGIEVQTHLLTLTDEMILHADIDGDGMVWLPRAHFYTNYLMNSR